MKTFNLYRILGIISFLFLLAACGQSELEECESMPTRQAGRGAPDSVRVVPLYVYMEKPDDESRALPSDYGVNFWSSWGEKNPHLSVARNLRFYVFQRNAGTSGEFLYVSSLSNSLSNTWSSLRDEDNYYGKPFYVREFQFRKEEGKEYKILVTAFGEKNEDAGSTGKQMAVAACCRLNYTGTGGTDLTDGTPLSELQAVIEPKSTYEPKIGGIFGSGAASLNYNTLTNVYSLQENFYGFCEQQAIETGDVHIITFDDKTALRAYLYRNVAKVIFKIQKIWWGTTNHSSFQWMGIYADNVTTSLNADNYDAFKNANPESGWKLLTYFNEDKENKNSPYTINGFGDNKFDKDDMGNYQLVTYMLPTTTSFRIRVSSKWIATRYCNQYMVPIRKLNSASGSNATGVVDEIIVSTDQIKIERNKEYVININYRVLTESSNDLKDE